MLGHQLLLLAPEHKNTALGLATFLGLAVSAGWQPIVGALSDRTRSPWGRRVPYFLAGTLLLALTLAAVAAGSSLPTVVAGLVGAELALNTILSPWQALIPDHVPASQRGAASGLKAAFDILSFILGRQVSGHLVAEGRVAAAVAIAFGLVALALLLTILAGRGLSTPLQDPAPSGGFRKTGVLRAFLLDRRPHPSFRWWFLNRFAFWFGFVALNTFVLFYLIDVIGMQEAEAQHFVANLSALLGLALLAVVVPSGWLTDRIGRRPLLLVAGPLALVGTGALMVARHTAAFAAAGVMLGLAAGMFLSANWALATDIVPSTEAARYLGIANLAGAGGSALARLLGGALIDPLGRLTGDPFLGYAALYALSALGFILGIAAALKLPHAAPSAPPA